MLDSTTSARRQAIRHIAVGGVIMVVGIVGLAFPFIGFTTAQDWSLLEEEAARFAAMPDVSAPTVPGASGTPTPTPDTRHLDVRNRLVIPVAGVDMPILEGDETSSLLKGGWLFPGTATPGELGNTVIFGHRFRYLPPLSNTFFRLDKVNRGDELKLTWNGELYTYRVIDIRTIEPDDFSVLDQRTPGIPYLTLVTCAPAFSTRYRLVVVGQLVQ